MKRKESRSGIEPRSFRLPAYRLTARPDRLSTRAFHLHPDIQPPTDESRRWNCRCTQQRSQVASVDRRSGEADQGQITLDASGDGGWWHGGESYRLFGIFRACRSFDENMIPHLAAERKGELWRRLGQISMIREFPERAPLRWLMFEGTGLCLPACTCNIKKKKKEKKTQGRCAVRWYVFMLNCVFDRTVSLMYNIA